MADRPGDYNKPSDSHVGEPEQDHENATLSSLDLDWSAADTRMSGGRAVVDRAAAPEHGVLTLQYGDPNFDRKLQTGGYDTLQIDGLPHGVGISSWLDNNGVFFWFKNGSDNRTRHYLPPGLKTIVVNGVRQDCDEMRLEATQAYLAEADPSKVGFSSISASTNPLEYAQRLSTIGSGALALEEKTLAQAAYFSPTNPYFRIYLADIAVAQAMEPIRQEVLNGQSIIDLNNPQTIQGIDYALQQLQTAQQICNQYGDVGMPNTEMMPGLYPFALNPAYYNPEMYWNGALYQTYQREALLNLVKGWMQNAGQLELPPVLPPG